LVGRQVAAALGRFLAGGGGAAPLGRGRAARAAWRRVPDRRDRVVGVEFVRRDGRGGELRAVGEAAGPAPWTSPALGAPGLAAVPRGERARRVDRQRVAWRGREAAHDVAHSLPRDVVPVRQARARPGVRSGGGPAYGR